MWQVSADDFILKPVRHSEMLDWLANRLQLTWLEAPAAATPLAPPSATTTRVWPPAAQLDALREVVALGYYRGILNKLDDIDAAQPQCAALVDELRGLARQFQFEAMLKKLTPANTP